MGCCSDCQSGLSGCCEQSGGYDLARRGLDEFRDGLNGGLSGLYGLDNLMGALVAARSRVRVGFEYQSNASIAQHNEGLDSASHIQTVLTNAMVEFGIFTDAFVQVKEPGWGGLQNGYITTVGTVFKDVSDPYDIGTQILGLIRDFLPVLTVTRRDPVYIDYVPPEAASRPGVQQVYNESQVRTQGQQQPGECNWDQQSFGDYIACQLGISSPIGGVGVGAVGALLAVGLGTLVLVAVLRR